MHARGQVANALAVARGGRSASAERMLREALGVFERRRQYAGAALAAATLSLVLRKRGQVSRANDALYDVARDAGARAMSRRLRCSAGAFASVGFHHPCLDRPCRRKRGVDTSVGGRRLWVTPVG